MSGDIALIGLRGSGKTTLGRRLAERLRRPFVDLDDRTPAVAGKRTIADVFSDLGEAAFRDAEVAALEQLLAEDAGPRVVALGGGTPTAVRRSDGLRARDLLRSIKPIYLRISPETQADRLRSAENAHRPSLTGADAAALGELRAVFARRDPLYTQIAGAIIEADARTQDETLAELERLAL